MPPIIGQHKDTLLAVLAQAGLTDISQIQPLADGLSNHNYHIETPTAHYVLRENADAADSFCSREQELFYWRHLAKAKLAPELLWVSGDQRYYLSEFIFAQSLPSLPIASQFAPLMEDVEGRANLLTEEPIAASGIDRLDNLVSREPSMASGYQELSLPNLSRPNLSSNELSWKELESQCCAATFCLGEAHIEAWLQSHADIKGAADKQAWYPSERLAVLEAITPNRAHSLLLQLLQQLREQATGPYHISITEQWQEYHAQLLDFAAADKGEAWQSRLAQLLSIQRQIHGWMATLADCLVKPQFCHRDLNPHNLLLKDNQLYCIDFEYTTASHPLCELAVVLATHQLTPAQRHLLVRQYLAGHPGLTSDAIKAIPAAIEMYWVFAVYWALLMAAHTHGERQQEYFDWFDLFWPLISHAS
ncbi:phosphotransferase [Shewanella sp. GD03713]|uniref:phosphotransferase n=1 Tax=Shewanella sp. GD03713 TaxID=2975372 RepID=UPI000B347493|nr:phosphotransferase [Shewanella sp. GD03713]MDH1470797.1 phosphotransferase [Shewanella sp. GD03713]QXN26550.1 phosphotransferase [Shewanella putrefaciens]